MPASDAWSNPSLTLTEYYRLPAVRNRILEYLGGGEGCPPTCAYLAALRPGAGPFPTWDDAEIHPVEALDHLLADGADLARSLWDRDSLLIHLDIDYSNADAPAEAFTHPAETFFKLEPTYRATRRVLAAYRLDLRAIVTGAGYHFVGRVAQHDPVVIALAGLHPEPPGWVRGRAHRRLATVAGEVTPALARAYAGLGMVMEYLAHQIVRAAAAESPIPVVLNGIIVGPVFLTRESVSIDLSFAADPAPVRHIRVAFGAYQRHRWRPDLMGQDVAARAPILIAIPRGDLTLESLLAGSRRTGPAAWRAERECGVIPEVAAGLAALIDDYLRSPVAAIHARFYEEPPELEAIPAAWLAPEGPEALPPCVRACLETPNDRLLEPTGLQHVTRALLSRGWSPRRIAGAVQLLYLRDHGWGTRWERQDPRTRAEVYVRVFATLLRVGLDEAMDFNCVSAQEKGLCPRTGCVSDLRVDRAELLRRVAP